MANDNNSQKPILQKRRASCGVVSENQKAPENAIRVSKRTNTNGSGKIDRIKVSADAPIDSNDQARTTFGFNRGDLFILFYIYNVRSKLVSNFLATCFETLIFASTNWPKSC